MPGVTQASAIKWAGLIIFAKKQEDPLRFQMLKIIDTQNDLYKCWFWQRRKIKKCKLILDNLHKDYPYAYNLLIKNG